MGYPRATFINLDVDENAHAVTTLIPVTIMTMVLFPMVVSMMFVPVTIVPVGIRVVRTVGICLCRARESG